MTNISDSSSSIEDGALVPSMNGASRGKYSYSRIFKPTGPDGNDPLPPSTESLVRGDQTNGLEYVYNEEIILAVNIAIVTGRPLLVSGFPGSGKSSLARSVAKWLGWRYYVESITSRTQARDLQWHFDTLRRLGDAQVAVKDRRAFLRLQDAAAYIEPGILWWAFDSISAQRRGLPDNHPVQFPAKDPAIDLGPRPEAVFIGNVHKANSDVANYPQQRAVVLLDEIDKADPDVPNDLLLPLGTFEFTIAETETVISLHGKEPPPLIVITTNGERELPTAFLRRCLSLQLLEPDIPWLITVAVRHFGADTKSLYNPLAQQTISMRDHMNVQIPPSTAEFLDAVRACLELDVRPDPGNESWEAIKRATLLKARMSEGII
jgi:MoxR-like ATPase